ncbi:MAG: hypothetical protein PHX27_02820, partial [Candidatus ainarchaeum sp.]|nr:hypothetical protein [Candidatus ainarchaeum sp.]
MEKNILFSKKFHQNNSAQGTIGNFSKKFHQNNSAQGTVEYLIVIAIVIVIGLVVAGLATNLFDSQQITQTNNQLKGQLGTGGISIVEGITNTTNETGLLNFRNNTGETITLTKITVDSKVNEYDGSIPSGNNELIKLDNTCECAPNQKMRTCEFQITYKTKYGLEKTITQKTTIQCEKNPEPAKEPIVPIKLNCFDINANPIEICSLQDLNQIRDKLDGNYILMKDIDATPTKEWDGGFEPIAGKWGNWSSNDWYYSYFEGNFNGNNKNISNLFIYLPSRNYVGLFGYSAGTIQNTLIIDQNITGYDDVGGLAGHVRGSVQNCYSSGYVNGNDYVGGLIGSSLFSTGIISESKSSSNVFGRYNIGGLVGSLNQAIVKKSYSLGDVNGVSSVGGLIGKIEAQSIVSESYSSGLVS